MTHTTDPRRFWALTKIALVPSLWWENQPLVVIEAMINGIPFIGSNRGGIPETAGDAGVIFSLPDRLTPVSKIVPEAHEVEPWIEAVIRLWDDERLYAEQSALALTEAQRRRPERLRPLYAEFFRNVRNQPGAPVLNAFARTREGEPPCEPRRHPARTEPRPPTTAHGPFVDNTTAGPGSNATAPRDMNGGRLALSVVACVSDQAILEANLLASPGLTGPGSPHQVILIHDAPSAAAGLTMGWTRAKHPWVVYMHQDVYLSEGWDR